LASIQGIMARSSLPTASMGWLFSCCIHFFIRGRPHWFSSIQSLAKEPSFTSARRAFMVSLTLPSMTFLPAVRSPYLAVSLTE
jgi:hypothetical protein